MAQKYIVVLSILCALSACAEPGDRDFAVRPLWKYSFKARFAKMMCAQDSYFRSCLPSTEEECSTALRTTLFDDCYEREGAAVPFILSLPSEGQHWGSVLGRCMGEQYYEEFKDRLDEDSEACRTQAAALGIRPPESALDRFYRLNPSAKVIAAHRPHAVRHFKEFASAFDNASASDNSDNKERQRGEKLFADYKLFEAKLLASTSDEGIINLYRNSTAQKKALWEISPELCNKVYFERAEISEDEQKLLDASAQPQLRKEADALTVTAVKDALQAPIARDEAAAEPILERALAELPELEGCAAAIEMSERLLALPQEEAGICLRAIHFESLRQTFGEARLAAVDIERIGRSAQESSEKESSAQEPAEEESEAEVSSGNSGKMVEPGGIEPPTS